MSIRYPVMVFSSFVKSRSTNRGTFLASVSRADGVVARNHLEDYLQCMIANSIPTLDFPGVKMASRFGFFALTSGFLWPVLPDLLDDLEVEPVLGPDFRAVERISVSVVDAFGMIVDVRVEVVNSDQEYLQWASTNEVTLLETQIENTD